MFRCNRSRNEFLLRYFNKNTWSQDVSILLQGHAQLYGDYLPKKYEQFDYTTSARHSRNIRYAFSVLLSQLVEPGGTHYAPSVQLTVETV